MEMYHFYSTAQPLHWIYKVEKLDSLLDGAEEVGFWEPSQNPFYTLPLGSQSCYGDQSFVILNSLVENKGMMFLHTKHFNYKKLLIYRSKFWNKGKPIQEISCWQRSVKPMQTAMLMLMGSGPITVLSPVTSYGVVGGGGVRGGENNFSINKSSDLWWMKTNLKFVIMILSILAKIVIHTILYINPEKFKIF